jgi:hypothetical protein
MPILCPRSINGHEIVGILFTDASGDGAFFYDAHGNAFGRNTTPRPSIMVQYKKRTYHTIQLLPTAHSHLLASDIRLLLATSDGQWLRDCTIQVYNLEYPIYNLSGKESECPHDLKSLSPTKQLVDK